MNRPAVALQQAHRIGPVGGDEDGVARRLERAAAERAHRLLVLHDEDRPEAAGGRLTRGSGGEGGSGTGRRGAAMEGLERATLPRLAVGRVVVFAMLPVAVHRRE